METLLVVVELKLVSLVVGVGREELTWWDGRGWVSGGAGGGGSGGGGGGGFWWRWLGFWWRL